MANEEGARVSTMSEKKSTASRPFSENAGAAKSPKLPPETSENVWLRRSAIFSFWAVALFFGLPIWLKTTAVYRAELPLQRMMEWAEGSVCKPTFPLHIAIEAPVPPQDAHHLIQMTQLAIDDLNDFPAHHLRLSLSESSNSANATQQRIRDGTSAQGTNEDVALTVRLISVETSVTPRSRLQPYSLTLDIYYPANQISQHSSANIPLATFIAQELHSLFEEEHRRLAHLLANSPGAQTERLKPLAPDSYVEIERQSARALKYAPTYHLTFSLFTPSHLPSAWDIETALQTYIRPLLDSLSGISTFTVDTQLQLYAACSPSLREPQYDEQAKTWTLNAEDLGGFVNAAEWPLSPSIGDGPTVNFVLYVPEKTQSPLVVKESGANSWLIPQWGGVHILNVNSSSGTPTTLTTDALAPAMHTFQNQLIALFGLPQSPNSLPLRISTLRRIRATSVIFSASSTLGALAQVYQKLPSIPVPDSVAQSVEKTIDHLQQSCDLLREGRFQRALEHARTAEVAAEKAFFERSMVGQVYFPDEHKVAVYLPLLGPVAVPLIMAALKEFKAWKASRRG